MKTLDYLRGIYAPCDFLEWARSRPRHRRQLHALWQDCPRGDWMLWLVRWDPEPDLAGIVAAAHACAMLAHDYAAGSTHVARTYADAATVCAASATRRFASSAADEAANAVRCAANAAAFSTHSADADTIVAAQRDCADMVRLLVREPVMP